MPLSLRSLIVRTQRLLLVTAFMSASLGAQELPSGSVHSASLTSDTSVIAMGSEPLPKSAPWEQLLKQTANDLKETPYRLGGSSQHMGLDCSGLIKEIWQRIGFADLPHKAASMAKLGVPVQLRNIQVGDLIFFNTTGKQNSHVGVYIGDGRFIHASSVLKKVTENALTERYYQRTFNGIRRIADLGGMPDARTFSD